MFNMENKDRGYLGMYLGPMFSGKTSAIVRNFRRYKTAGKSVLVLNHSLDKRYSQTELSTHDRITIPCQFTEKLADVRDLVLQHDVVLLNEAQFFEDLREQVIDWVDSLHKVVVVCGLDGTSDKEAFGQMLELIPHADSYEKLTSICEMCGMSAPFTHRSKSASNGCTIQVGVSEYKALCRSCFAKA